MKSDSDPCHSCGVCCLTVGAPPFRFSDSGGKDDRASLPEPLAMELIGYLRSPRYAPRGPCVWLNIATGRCRHYEHRPMACRDYEAGGLLCNVERSKWKMKPISPHWLAFDERPPMPIPADFNPETERRRIKQGGCCGQPTE